MVQDGIHNYKIALLQNATDLEAVVMLYDEAILRFKNAKEKFLAHDPVFKDDVEAGGRIIDGLSKILDFEKGQDIAVNLAAIYTYVSKRMTVVKHGVKFTPKYLDECIGMLLSLRDAWDTLAMNEKKQKSGDPKAAVKPANPHLEISI